MDSDDVASILPSYQMYQSTISQSVVVAESSNTDTQSPPRYELTPQSSAVSSTVPLAVQLPLQSPGISEPVDYFGDLPAALDLTRTPFEQPPHDDSVQDFTPWEDTILANTHRLKRLPSLNLDVLKHLQVHILLTKRVGRRGEKPEIVDPLSTEYKQGDSVYGFVTVRNTTAVPVPFDMFAVVLEGAAVVGDTHRPTASRDAPANTHKFLNMFDFNALWNDGCLDRLPGENHDPHFIFLLEDDPYDGAATQLDYRKVFVPGVTYKKFFTFTFPEKLLDGTCAHDLVKHLQMPPTVGVLRAEIVARLRQKWRDADSLPASTPGAHPPPLDRARYALPAQDFSFDRSSVSYSVSARIIGRASLYLSFLSVPVKPTEYVVANEDNCFLRCIFTTHSLFELNRSMINEEARLLYDNLLRRVEDKIALGNELVQVKRAEALSRGATNSPALSPTLSPSVPGVASSSAHPLATSASGASLTPTHSSTELQKMRQSYYAKVRPTHHTSRRDTTYEVLVSYKKKSVLGLRAVGLLALATPKTEYMASYLAGTGPSYSTADTCITVPIELSFMPTDPSASAPEIKKISAELVALTVKSPELAIPVVIHPDMVFRNTGRDESFDALTVRRFGRYASLLARLAREVGPAALELDRDLVQDVKALAHLGSKCDTLKLTRPWTSRAHARSLVPVGDIPWERESLSDEQDAPARFFKHVDVHLDLANASVAGTGTAGARFALVPDFQCCILARLYYVRLTVKLANGDKLSVKVPVVLQRRRQGEIEEPII